MCGVALPKSAENANATAKDTSDFVPRKVGAAAIVFFLKKDTGVYFFE